MVRIGIVGCGRILNAHLRGFRVLREHGDDDFRITALTARRREDAESHLVRGEGPPQRPIVTPPESNDPLGVADEYLSDFQDDVDVGVFTDYQEMIESGSVDAVNDYTSVYLHHKIAELTLKAGLHLLTQKPLAVSVAAARYMDRLARENERVFGVTEVVRYRKINRALAWAAAEAIGDPQLFVVGSLGGLWSPDLVVAETPWRHKKLLAGGGGAIDIGVHLAHLLRMVLGTPVSVQATAKILEPRRYIKDKEGKITETVDVDVDDTVIGTYEFESGASATLTWSWACRQQSVAIEGAPVIVGSKGTVRGGRLESDGDENDLLSAYDASLSAEDRERFYPRGITNEFALNQLTWLQAIWDRDSGSKGDTFEANGAAGTQDLAAAFAMLESSDAGRRVAIADVESGALREHQRDIDAHYELENE